jgi:predicted transposase YdaD
MKGGREGGKEGGREEGRKEVGREGGREGGREEGRKEESIEYLINLQFKWINSFRRFVTQISQFKSTSSVYEMN